MIKEFEIYVPDEKIELLNQKIDPNIIVRANEE